ncbi:MAG: hypothetical protein QXR78_00310 [Nitrososphaerota archaeon]
MCFRFKSKIIAISSVVEGPTAKAYAIEICKKFSNERIKGIFVRSRKVFAPVEEIVGRKFVKSDSIGKNILFFFDCHIVIRVHLMMYGVIHVYKADEPLLKPMDRVRLMLIGDSRKIVIYNAPIVEIGLRDQVLGRLKTELGPDPLSDEWDEERVYENITKFREEKIGIVLLNQSVIAGIGNILRNEILFRVGVNPERKVGDLSPEEIHKIIYYAKELSRQYLELKIQGKRIKDILRVYNRFSSICEICGHPIKFYRQKPINRKTFVCENCQR